MEITECQIIKDCNVVQDVYMYVLTVFSVFLWCFVVFFGSGDVLGYFRDGGIGPNKPWSFYSFYEY